MYRCKCNGHSFLPHGPCAGVSLAAAAPLLTTTYLIVALLVAGGCKQKFVSFQGQIFVDPGMPSAAPAERRAAYLAMAQTLAALHSVDFRAVGLENFGRHSGYCSRQVKAYSLGKQVGLVPP